MFLIGFDMWGHQAFDSKVCGDSPVKLELSNGKYDEWKVDDGKIDYSDDKQDWTFSTIMLAGFDNTLEAGNLSNNGYEIEHLIFKRRRKDGLAWTVIGKLEYNVNQRYYKMIDRLVGIGDWEYCIVPSSQNIEGIETIKDIYVEFDNVYVCSKDNSIRLIYDVEYSEMGNNSTATEITTLESKYPFIFDTPTCYQSGTISASLFSETSVYDRRIDPSSERQLRNNVINELNKKCARVIKSPDGKNQIVYIKGVRETYDYVTGTYKVTFDYSEIADYENSLDLERVGLLEVGGR